MGMLTKPQPNVKVIPSLPQDRADWAIRRIVRFIVDLEEGRIPNPYPPTPRKPTKKKCPKSLRRRVFAAFARCEYCGRQPEGDGVRKPSVDRIAARGPYAADNVTMACLLCNSAKADKEFIGPVRTLEIMERAA